jgi:predicted amidohydrolase
MVSDRYSALALQMGTDCVNECPDRDSARRRMHENLTRAGRLIAGSKGFVKQFSGDDVRLVVLPEYFLTGFPMGESVPEWRDKAAIEPGGPEYDALGELAKRFDVYLAGNAYECDPHFPTLFFQTCFVIDPAGDVVLRYRRLISLSAPTPWDVWDRYLEIYGLDAVFPVARTELGNLAAIASEEILYPEIARCHAIRGAEVFLHHTSEVGSPALTPKDVCRRARAIENMAFVVSANSARLENIAIPAESSTGMSKIVDYQGRVLAEAPAGAESMVANATIDLAGLRATRRRTGMSNLLSRHPLELFAEGFAGVGLRPKNRLLQDGEVITPERGQLAALQHDDILRLADDGVL